MKRASYLLAYTIPLSVWGSVEFLEDASLLALLYTFGFLPLLELFLPVLSKNQSDETLTRIARNRYFDLLLYSMVPIQWFLVFRFCHAFQYASSAEFDSGFLNPTNMLAQIGLISALGIACGVIGINVAHELGHRKSRHERILARLLLATSLNWQFYIEHNRGHHKNVSTPNDPESARLNESVYSFFVRAIRDSFRNAWKLDRRELLIGIGFESALLLGIGIFFGAKTLLAFSCSALFGILLLQAVNYIEHYGLTRKETSPGVFEPVKPRHSWNANPYLSRAILFELSRHSDHHAHATRKYQTLRHHDDSPQMPTGYPGMILLALVPSLWFKIMNAKIP
ncbi:MAG: alkane 1-monooxygenase [Bdellovibrionales bacterium]|nr:alkane 1-monooxygenase [Bdellovibrionales bacterium]